jgi:hypothetical protein
MQRGCAVAPAEEVEVSYADEGRRHARGHSARFFDLHLHAFGDDLLSDGVLQQVAVRSMRMQPQTNCAAAASGGETV